MDRLGQSRYGADHTAHSGDAGKPKGGLGDDEEGFKRFLNTATVIRIVRITKAPFSKEELLEINAKLNTIPKADV